MKEVKEEKHRSAKSVLAIVTTSHTMQHIYVGISILFPLIIADLNLSYTEFGIIIGASSLAEGFLQIVFSIISRKIAKHVLLGLGNIMLSVGTFLIGSAYNLIQFLTARLAASIGSAPQHPMGTSIISERFGEKSVGKAIGIHFGLAYIGNIIGPLFMTFLAAAIGWRYTLYIFSIPALIVGLTIIWFLGEGRRYLVVESKRKSTSLSDDVFSLIKTKTVMPVIMAQSLIAGGTGLGIIITYIPLFLADTLKLGIYERGIFYTIGLIGGVVGPVSLSRYGDKVGHLKIAIASTSIAAICIYALSFYSTPNLLLIPHLFVLGFTSFAIPSLLQSHLVKITHGTKRDLALGLYFTIGFSFSSIWASVFGYMIDVFSSFAPSFIVMGILGAIASLVLLGQIRYKLQQ